MGYKKLYFMAYLTWGAASLLFSPLFNTAWQTDPHVQCHMAQGCQEPSRGFPEGLYTA